MAKKMNMGKLEKTMHQMDAVIRKAVKNLTPPGYTSEITFKSNKISGPIGANYSSFIASISKKDLESHDNCLDLYCKANLKVGKKSLNLYSLEITKVDGQLIF